MQYSEDRQVTATLRRLGYCLSAAILLLSFFTSAAQASPAAGTIISNQAEASYHNDASGADETVYSNTTELVVAAVEGVSLVPDLSQTVLAGDTVRLPHRLTNTGNTTTTYTLSTSNLGGDDFDLLNVTMVHDLNGNGIDDPGEPVIPEGGNVTLTSGSFLDLVVVDNVRDGAEVRGPVELGHLYIPLMVDQLSDQPATGQHPYP